MRLFPDAIWGEFKDYHLDNTPCRNPVCLTANFMPEISQVIETTGEGSGSMLVN